MHLVSAGLVCPLGFDAASACAAMRAGIARMDELPYWDRRNLPVIGAAMPGAASAMSFGVRMVEMLARALRDCISRAPHTPHTPWAQVPLIVGLAEEGRPGASGEWAEDIVAGVQDRLGIAFHPALSGRIPKGHTAGFEGLRIARELLLARPDVPGCLVCGVDSYINASSLFWLDQHWRLKREGHNDGVIPGEAAAAVYVARQSAADAPARVEVVGLGFGREAAPVLSEAPLQGRGLADAARQAMGEAGWGFHQLHFRLSDVTGENYGFREHTLARGRLMRVVPENDQPLWHAADAIGDTGAAAGLVQLARALAAWEKAYAPGTNAACFTSGVPGDRAVALLRGATA
jgi:3-oxoacyl-[acyl-carrier-protein] synthase-1